MNDGFKLEIVNPEKSFLSKEDVAEVVVPAFEGDMGILKDHISIISFLKPGLLKIINSRSFSSIIIFILESNPLDKRCPDEGFLSLNNLETATFKFNDFTKLQASCNLYSIISKSLLSNSTCKTKQFKD